VHVADDLERLKSLEKWRARSPANGYDRHVPVFTVRVLRGPNWDPAHSRRNQRDWNEHAAFMDTLVEIGFVVLGGPVGDGTDVLLAVEAADEREVSEQLAPDPWLGAGVLEIGTVEPWTIWLDGRTPHAKRESAIPR
jgi:hypothetical protein